MTQPGESIQDKVHFIFNNISSQNMKQKVSADNFMLRWRDGFMIMVILALNGTLPPPQVYFSSTTISYFFKNGYVIYILCFGLF